MSYISKMAEANQKVKITSFSKLTESKIEGIAAIPRVSRNGRFYPPESLAALDGKIVPILWAHQGTPMKVGDQIPQDKIIGQATVHWDSFMQQLKYEGKVEEQYSSILKQYPELGVSIGAHYRNNHFCVKGGSCYDMATDLIFEEISLTPAAGMPETTVKLVEMVEPSVKQCGCKHGEEEPVKAEEDFHPELDEVSRLKLKSHIN